MKDIHPDLALLAQPERRAICCLCVESAGQNLSGLLEKKPFSRYVENGETALLMTRRRAKRGARKSSGFCGKTGFARG